jgi:hypothetical protein
MTPNDEEELDPERSCRVVEVAGHPPVDINELIGATTVTVVADGHECRLIGTGVKSNKSVLFYQKEAGSAVEAGSVWTMTDGGSGDIAARPPSTE